MPGPARSLLWEGIVVGRPFSANSGNKQAKSKWQSQVRAVARARPPLEPIQDDIGFLMVVFDQGQTGDVDNKIKYTLDALVGEVLHDDRYVRQVVAARHDVNDTLDLHTPSPVAADVVEHLLQQGPLPLVYLQIATAISTEDLLDAQD